MNYKLKYFSKKKTEIQGIFLQQFSGFIRETDFNVRYKGFPLVVRSFYGIQEWSSSVI